MPKKVPVMVSSLLTVLGCCEDFGQRNYWILLRCQGWLLITIVDFVGASVAEA